MNILDRRPIASQDQRSDQPTLPRSSEPFCKPQLHQIVDRDDHLLCSNFFCINQPSVRFFLGGFIWVDKSKQEIKKGSKHNKYASAMVNKSARITLASFCTLQGLECHQKNDNILLLIGAFLVKSVNQKIISPDGVRKNYFPRWGEENLIPIWGSQAPRRH